jgi:hypothetical protein
MLSPGFGAAPARCRAGTDEIALNVREAAEYRQHQATSADAGISPRFRQRAELRLGVHDALDDAEQVKRAAREPVNARHRHHVAGRQLPSRRLSSRWSARAPVTFSPMDVVAAASGGTKLFQALATRIADDAHVRVLFILQDSSKQL